MYRILVADDEGIMLEAFKSVISSTFGDSCITETALPVLAVSVIQLSPNVSQKLPRQEEQ